MSENPVLNSSDSDYIRDPYGALAPIREQAPITRAVVEGLDSWLVTGFDEAQQILADPRISNDGIRHAGPAARAVPWAGATTEGVQAHLVRVDPPDHTRLRRLVQKAFTPRRVAALEPRIREIAGELLSPWPATGDADLLADFANPLAVTVIAELFGVDAADLGEFRYWTDTYFVTSETQGDLVADASRRLATLLGELLARRREQLGDTKLDVEHEGTLFDGLILARDRDDRLDERELVTMVFLILAAGYETTANLIANGTLVLLSGPERWRRLAAEPKLLPAAIEELLRVDTPVRTPIARYATEEMRVAGAVNPAGDAVIVHFGAANHDPRRFADPDVYDPERWGSRPEGSHLAFGHGLHYCLGAPLARLEARVAFQELLAAYPGMELAVAPKDVEWRHSRIIRGLRGLPVRLG